MSEREGELGVEADVADEESAGQIDGSEGTPTHRERTQHVTERTADPPGAPPSPDGRNAPG